MGIKDAVPGILFQLQVKRAPRNKRSPPVYPVAFISQAAAVNLRQLEPVRASKLSADLVNRPLIKVGTGVCRQVRRPLELATRGDIFVI
jgi:hypothetical protein